jgi:hypothetical protein
MNHRPEVQGTDTVEEHEHPMNHRPEVEGMDSEDNGMERICWLRRRLLKESARVWYLARHWTDDEAAMSRRARREREELAKSGCSSGHTTFACRDFSCLTWRRV